MVLGRSNYGKISSLGLSPSVLVLGAVVLFCILTIVAYAVISLSSSPAINQGGASTLTSELVDVLIPIEKVEVGIALDPAMFRKESRVASALPATVVRSFDDIRGAYSASYMPAGQPLVAEYVTQKQPLNHVQVNIPDGYRAVSLAVDNTTSVEGWARPGAKVDVMLASSVNGRPALSVIIQNAKVLSAGRSTGNQPMGEKQAPASTITIMVSVDEAAKLQLASSSGVLSLAMRGDEDTIESAANTTIHIESLLATDGPKGPAPVTSEGKVVVEGKVFLIVNGKLVPEGQAVR